MVFALWVFRVETAAQTATSPLDQECITARTYRELKEIGEVIAGLRGNPAADGVKSRIDNVLFTEQDLRALEDVLRKYRDVWWKVDYQVKVNRGDYLLRKSIRERLAKTSTFPVEWTARMESLKNDMEEVIRRVNPIETVDDDNIEDLASSLTSFLKFLNSLIYTLEKEDTAKVQKKAKLTKSWFTWGNNAQKRKEQETKEAEDAEKRKAREAKFQNGLRLLRDLRTELEGPQISKIQDDYKICIY